MPPSAGACQTTDADVNPLCGRASGWSSTITAITWRAASGGATRTPVSGAGTRTGVGAGVGDGVGVGSGVGVGASVGMGVGVGVTTGATARPEPAGVGAGVVVEPQAATQVARTHAAMAGARRQMDPRRAVAAGVGVGGFRIAHGE